MPLHHLRPGQALAHLRVSGSGPTRSVTNARCCGEVEWIVRTGRRRREKLRIDFAETLRLRVIHE